MLAQEGGENHLRITTLEMWQSESSQSLEKEHKMKQLINKTATH